MELAVIIDIFSWSLINFLENYTIYKLLSALFAGLFGRLVACSTEEVSPSFAKIQLKSNGGFAKLGLTPPVKWATERLKDFRGLFTWLRNWLRCPVCSFCLWTERERNN